MKRLRTAVQIGISIIAFASYVSAANHCAFEATTAQEVPTADAHKDCPEHQSGGQNDKENGIECCKAFPPASFSAAKSLVGVDSHSFALQTYFALLLGIQDRSQLELRPLELDTGPPFASSFVETVLQRSILAHAPPFFA